MTDEGRRGDHRRFAWFVAVAGAAVIGAAVFVWTRLPARNGQGTGAAVEATSTGGTRAPSLDELRRGSHVYYRSVRPEEFGRVVVADLAAPNDRRVVTDLACDRVDFGREVGICLADTRGPAGLTASARIVTRDFAVRGEVELPGVPIRARLSPDERYAAATVFVTGERYDSDFTTRTVLIDTQTGRSLGDLEQFATSRDGRPFSRVDFNFWGVTFAGDGARFFATLGTAGQRYLVEGDVDGRRLETRRDNVECPSLAPDERTIAFKSRVPGTREWRVHVLDVATGVERRLAQETRSIDDQIEWLDAGHVLYQHVDERGLPHEAMHVWTLPVAEADAGVGPAIFIRAGNSPAVVRP